jgi:hypothetical protein
MPPPAAPGKLWFVSPALNLPLHLNPAVRLLPDACGVRVDGFRGFCITPRMGERQ